MLRLQKNLEPISCVEAEIRKLPKLPALPVKEFKGYLTEEENLTLLLGLTSEDIAVVKCLLDEYQTVKINNPKLASKMLEMIVIRNINIAASKINILGQEYFRLLSLDSIERCKDQDFYINKWMRLLKDAKCSQNEESMRIANEIIPAIPFGAEWGWK